MSFSSSESSPSSLKKSTSADDTLLTSSGPNLSAEHFSFFPLLVLLTALGRKASPI
jgi:hypothetical protein